MAISFKAVFFRKKIKSALYTIFILFLGIVAERFYNEYMEKIDFKCVIKGVQTNIDKY